MSTSIRIISSMTEVNRQDWNRLCPADFPFWDYDFLLSLEQSQCLGFRTGWHPMYLLAYNQSNLAGALPLYIKTNSYGEYIFDWQWAQAYDSHGIRYYPKLLSATPFTPANGGKLLFPADSHAPKLAAELLSFAKSHMLEREYSSIHGLFLSELEAPYWQKAGFKLRKSYQYHWFNAGYSSFEDYLAELKGKRRRQLIKERNSLAQSGLRFRRLTADQINSEHGQLFYQFYKQTLSRKASPDYLTQDFFLRISSRMQDRLIMVLAEDSFGKILAGSLSFAKGPVIYGRYWGSLISQQFLHFELCYYQLIEHAICQKFQRVEAGAQGSHKLQRGFQPTTILSGHYIANPAFREAIEQYINEEANIMEEDMDFDRKFLPFRSPPNLNP